jgi:hypothetical protein
MTTNYFNAYTQALGAFRLIPIFLGSLGVVSRATLIGAACEGIDLLKSTPCRTTELAEVFRFINNVIQDGQVAYVTPTNSPEYPFGAVVADTKGHICAAAMGKNKEDLAELIRLKLARPSEGLGEASA